MRDRPARRRAPRWSAWPTRVGLSPIEVRVGHPRHRQREHGRRRARAHRRARPRPARLRAALHRRRRARPRLLRGEEARPDAASSARRRPAWPPRSACWWRRPAWTASPPSASAWTADSGAALERRLPPTRDRGARGDGRHRPRARHRHACAVSPTAASSVRASTSSSTSPTGPTTTPTPAGGALTAAFETAYREKFALTPPGRAGGVHQHPRGGARAGGGRVGRRRRARRREPPRRRRQGSAARVLPGASGLRGDDRVRPRAPGRRATRSAAPPWSRRKARRW